MRNIVVISTILLVIPILAFATPVPDTGQGSCYDDTQEITCPTPGEPFYGQDAQVVINPQSYTKLGRFGNPLPDRATEWIMVRDNITRLIWEVKTDDGSIHDKDNTYPLYGSTDVIIDFIDTLNSQNFGGYSDWRLPNTKELFSIVNSNIPNPGPTINSYYFPNTAPSHYWSSTIQDDYSQYFTWFVNFSGGAVGYEFRLNNYHVRAVRGRQTSNNFIDNGDGTVTDTHTRLMWQKDNAPGMPDQDGGYNWQQALLYCENLALAGYDDWRLPNIKELQSIVDYNTRGPALDPVFPDPSSAYWSSTTIAFNPDRSWSTHFHFGQVFSLEKVSIVYVRAVRGGQCGAIICPAEKIYGEQSEATELLRYFRDNILEQTVEGRELIKLYYQWSPFIVKLMEVDTEIQGEVKEVLDTILPFLREAKE